MAFLGAIIWGLLVGRVILRNGIPRVEKNARTICGFCWACGFGWRRFSCAGVGVNNPEPEIYLEADIVDTGAGEGFPDFFLAIFMNGCSINL